MKCVYCKQEVPYAQYCGMCGWNQLVSPETATLRAIHDSWMSKRYPKIGIQTRRDYNNAWNKLKPLWDVPVSKVDVDDLQDVLDFGCGASVSAKSKVKILIRMLYQYAIAKRLTSYDLSPSLKIKGRAPAPRVIFSSEQIDTLIHYANNVLNPRFQTARIVLTLIFTGFRPNGIFRLLISDCHIKDGYFVGGGKTKAGTNRVVPILPIIRQYVQDWYLFSYFQDKQHYEKRPLIQNSVGGHINLKNWSTRQFYPLMRELGFIPVDVLNQKKAKPHLTPYSCRHTFATMAYTAGVDKADIIKIMGHVDFDFTNREYIHQDFRRLKQELAKLETQWEQVT